MVEEIEDFLAADEHTDPEDILKVAKQVLAIELPDSNKINELKEKMNSLSIRPSDSSSPEDNLSLTAVTSIAQKATKVLREAQELSDKVITEQNKSLITSRSRSTKLLKTSK